MLIIGAGPAGMEAARVAALRGHRVVLYEKEPRLGGMLNLGSVPPGKAKLRWISEYFAYELPRLGVELHLGEPLDAPSVRALHADVVIVATGSKVAAPDIPGADGPNVLFAQEILAHEMHFVDQDLAVVGGGLLGLETANYLSAQHNKVTVLKRYETVSRHIEPLYRDYLLRELKKQGVCILAHVNVKTIRPEGVLVMNQEGEEEFIVADHVVWARGVKPANELAKALQDLGPIVIGDAVQPRKIIDAIREGFMSARDI
ncbi:MAG: NAD(P)/FAD-dependent oxidoreductase [Alphaproteobacteria bacterium]